MVMKKRVLILLANGFEDVEAFFPIDVLRRCGVDLTTVAVGGNEGYIESSNKVTVKADIGIENVNLEKYNRIDMLIIPGGPGRANLRNNDRAMALIRDCCDMDIAVAAICGAPELLGEIGFLEGKRATCYPGSESKMTGAEYSRGTSVVKDGNLITARGAGCSAEFAFAIAEFLCGKEKAEEIADKMIYSSK